MRTRGNTSERLTRFLKKIKPPALKRGGLSVTRAAMARLTQTRAVLQVVFERAFKVGAVLLRGRLGDSDGAIV